MTIARGETPEKAFWVAQHMGWNGPEIRRKEGYIMFDVPDLRDTETPTDYAFKMAKSLRKGKLDLPRELSGCVQIRQADPDAEPKNYFLDRRKNAYLFFGCV